ncbi:MAG: arsenate reductase family protein [Clostridia bacterium]|nr:arsenate reductase family protein [Clostridia bacterium]
MLFVCYPKCSTCQKAKKYLDDRGAEYELRDIKADNPSADELKKWIKLSGLPVKRFFNTSGMQYRALGLKDKIDKMSEDEQISLLASDGMLVKRPLLIAGETVLAGFREPEYEKALG